MQHTLHNFVLLYNNCKRLPRTRDGVDNGGHGAPLGHQQQQGNDCQQGLQKVEAQMIEAKEQEQEHKMQLKK